MVYNGDLYSTLGFQQSYVDLLAIVRDSPNEEKINSSANSITPNNILPVESFAFKITQESLEQNRLAGGSADPNTFNIHPISIRSNIKMPLVVPVIGWVGQYFADLWDCAGLAHWGTPTATIANLTSDISIGTSILNINNPADFVSLPTPFNLYIKSLSHPENSENISVTSVDKSNRTLTLISPVLKNHTKNDTLLITYSNTLYSPPREPSFSLFSLREGLLTPSLINQLTIEAQIGQSININCEIASLNIFRDSQLDMHVYKDALRQSYGQMPISMIANSYLVSISPLTTDTNLYGLPTALGDELFAGYQSFNLPSAIVTGITLTIENSLNDVYSAHSMKSGSSIYRDNRMPYALVSNGRTIKGTIKYLSPIDPYLLAERLAGPSGLNGGGIRINFGMFYIDLPTVAWKPSTSEGNVSDNQTRTLEFTFVGNTFDSMPTLNYTSV